MNSAIRHNYICVYVQVFIKSPFKLKKAELGVDKRHFWVFIIFDMIQDIILTNY